MDYRIHIVSIIETVGAEAFAEIFAQRLEGDTCEKIVAISDIIGMMSQVYPPDAVQGWFRRRNPFLGTQTPVAIVTSNIDAVRKAAEMYAEGF